jgi:hypothetical protein
MSYALRLAAVAGVMALLAVGCGDDDDTSAAVSSASAAVTTATTGSSSASTATGGAAATDSTAYCTAARSVLEGSSATTTSSGAFPVIGQRRAAIDQLKPSAPATLQADFETADADIDKIAATSKNLNEVISSSKAVPELASALENIASYTQDTCDVDLPGFNEVLANLGASSSTGTSTTRVGASSTATTGSGGSSATTATTRPTTSAAASASTSTSR